MSLARKLVVSAVSACLLVAAPAFASTKLESLTAPQQSYVCEQVMRASMLQALQVAIITDDDEVETEATLKAYGYALLAKIMEKAGETVNKQPEAERRKLIAPYSQRGTFPAALAYCELKGVEEVGKLKPAALESYQNQAQALLMEVLTALVEKVQKDLPEKPEAPSKATKTLKGVDT